MVGFIIRVLIVAAGLWVAAHIVPGIHYNTDEDLLLAAFLLGLANAIIRPILVIVTFPITIITLGLFLLVINGLMLELVAFFLHGFQVHGLFAAILGAVVVGLTGWVASWFIGPSGRFEAYRRY
jgi:putative membrane protein